MTFTKTSEKVVFVCLLLVLASIFVGGQTSQKAPVRKTAGVKVAEPATGGPVVTKIDEIALKKVLHPNGKPLLVNFWATWCDPCREEFPDLVKIDADYKGKVDFITITLDDAADIKTAVPKFLSDMKAPMPSYLLVTPDEGAVITSIAKDWTGGLPFTVLYNDKGDMQYFRQGKVKVDLLRSELDKLSTAATSTSQSRLR
jgi:thiol-disulfide isomerase/thioredoxin